MAKRYLPHDLKPWATDANFPAGANPWSGQPNKVAPSAALAATGHIPNTRLPAPIQNWHLSRLTDAGLLATYSAMQRWRSYVINDSPGATAGIGGYTSSVALGGMLNVVAPYNASIGGGGVLFPERQLLIAVYYNGANLAYTLGSPGGHWSNVGSGALAALTAGGGTQPASVHGEFGDRAFFGSSQDADIVRTADSMATFTTDAAGGVGSFVFNFHMSHNGSKRMLAGLWQNTNVANRIYTHDTGGGSAWTARNVPASWQVNNLAVMNFADNGAGTILATGNKDGEILRSTDNGATWAAVTVPFNRHAVNTITCYGLAWSPVHNLFMLTGTGCAVSTDGQTWTSRSGIPARGTLTSHNNNHLLAAAGPVFAHVCNIDLIGGANHAVRGIWYTLDAGLTWYLAVFGKSNDGTEEQIVGVVPYNDGFCAWDGAGHVYISDPLAMPDPIYTFT
jgi:hypothetical protein